LVKNALIAIGIALVAVGPTNYLDFWDRFLWVVRENKSPHR